MPNPYPATFEVAENLHVRLDGDVTFTDPSNQPGGGGGGQVNSVTAGDASITVAGTVTDPTVAVAALGVTAGKIAASAVTQAKLAANAVGAAQMDSGAASANWVPVADGTGGVVYAASPGVNSLTAADTSIVVGGTSASPTVRTGTLDTIATQHPPTAAVALNSQKITGLANGTVSSDAAAFGQIPTALPPNGSAGGDLSGTYPNPTVAAVQGVAVSSTAPTAGQVLTASDATHAAWATGGGGSSPLTTKGDVYGYSTTNARIPVGANGQILTANSAASLGVSWLFSAFPIVNVVDYGAVHDGTTDDSTAINNAIAALPVTGGIVYFPAGDYAIASTINIGNGTSSAISTLMGVYLQGPAAPNTLAANMTGYGASRLKWTGASGGTMVSVNGPLYGWGLKNFYIDGNSLANIGIKNVSGQAGDCAYLTFKNCIAQSVYCTAVASFSSINTDAFHNSWRNIAVEVLGNQSSCLGILHTGVASANSCYDTWQNLFVSILATASGKFAAGVYLQGCDNIAFRDVQITCASGRAGTTYPINFDYAGPSATWPADCLFDHIDFGPANWSAVAANGGTPTGAAPNRVVAISGTNTGGTPPASPALANLKWGYTASNP